MRQQSILWAGAGPRRVGRLRSEAVPDPWGSADGHRRAAGGRAGGDSGRRAPPFPHSHSSCSFPPCCLLWPKACWRETADPTDPQNLQSFPVSGSRSRDIRNIAIIIRETFPEHLLWARLGGRDGMTHVSKLVLLKLGSWADLRMGWTSPKWSMAQTCVGRWLPREVVPVLGPEAQGGQKATCGTCEGALMTTRAVPAPSGSAPSSLHSQHLHALCPPSEELVSVSL